MISSYLLVEAGVVSPKRRHPKTLFVKVWVHWSFKVKSSCMKKNQVSFAFVCALSNLLLKDRTFLVAMNGSRPAWVFPRTWVCNQNQCPFICFRHLVWVRALLCWNNRPQAILSICKNLTPSSTWTIRVDGKTPWREIPLLKPSMWFSSMSFDIAWICAYLAPCAEYLPVFSTWNFSKLI